MKAEETFCKLVEKFTYKGEGRRSAQLTNITFFLGAGFAKSWDEHYPLGTELFEFDDILSKKGFESLVPFIEQCGFNPTKQVDFNIFSECYYKLEMLKKYPEIRPRYIDEQTISIVEAEFKALIWQALSERVRII